MKKTLEARIRSEFGLPWFKLFAWDWLNSETIASFTLEQEAIYIRLLMRQWVAKDGYLPADVHTLSRYARVDSRARWRHVGQPVLKQFFIRRNGHYWNEKLRQLWEDAREKQATSKRAAEVRWGKA